MAWLIRRGATQSPIAVTVAPGAGAHQHVVGGAGLVPDQEGRRDREPPAPPNSGRRTTGAAASSGTTSRWRRAVRRPRRRGAEERADALRGHAEASAVRPVAKETCQPRWASASAALYAGQKPSPSSYTTACPGSGPVPVSTSSTEPTPARRMPSEAARQSSRWRSRRGRRCRRSPRGPRPRWRRRG